jgi:hypothetical protein
MMIAPESTACGVNRAAVSQVPRYEFIKRDISWQSPVFFTPVDKQGEPAARFTSSRREKITCVVVVPISIPTLNSWRVFTSYAGW